jgi:hypothetical protein
VHPDAPSRRSTSRQSVALALIVCPVIPLCVVTTYLVAATDILRLRRARVPRHVARLVVDYFDYAARPDASARRAVRRATRRRLSHLRCASGCLGMSRGSSRRSSSTSSPTPCVRVPQHVARLIVDYFDYAGRLGARRVARDAARRQLLRLRRASGCLGTSHDTSHDSSSTTSPTPRVRVPRLVTRLIAPLVVNYIDYAARPSASARRAARHVTRRAAHHRLLHLRRASGCLGTSRGSSSTTSPMPCVRVPRHIARLVTWLVVDYSVRRDFVLRPHWLYFIHAVRCDYLSRENTGSTTSTPRAAATSSSGRIMS